MARQPAYRAYLDEARVAIALVLLDVPMVVAAAVVAREPTLFLVALFWGICWMIVASMRGITPSAYWSYLWERPLLEDAADRIEDRVRGEPVLR